MDDLIKRSDVIKYCQSKADHYKKRLARIEAQGDAIGYDPTEQINGFKDEIAIYESFMKELKGIPSAEKHGKWINAGILTVQCSNCKSEFHELEAMNFCPKCGADMQEGVDGETD